MYSKWHIYDILLCVTNMRYRSRKKVGDIEDTKPAVHDMHDMQHALQDVRHAVQNTHRPHWRVFPVAMYVMCYMQGYTDNQ